MVISKKSIPLAVRAVVALGVLAAIFSWVTFEHKNLLHARFLKPVTGKLLTNSTLGRPTWISTISMISTSQGFSAIEGSHRAYLSSTTTSGREWKILAALPLGVYSDYGFPARIAFANTRVGYAQKVDGTKIWMTNDRGRHWSVLRVPPGQSTFKIYRGELYVLGGTPSAPHRNEAFLSVFRVGDSRPLFQRFAPAFSGFPPLLFDVGVAGIIESSTAGDFCASPISQSSNDGASWRTVTNPSSLCLGDIFALTPTLWVLDAYRGGGMNQGTEEVWNSTTAGRQWQLVATSNESRFHIRGSVPDVSMAIIPSNDHRTLYAVRGGANSGVMVSTDLGAHWINTDLQNFDAGFTLEAVGQHNVMTLGGWFVYQGQPYPNSGNLTLVFPNARVRAIRHAY